MFVLGRTYSHVSPLKKNTPGCILRALRYAAATSSAETTAAESPTRIASVDRHPSNLVTERRLRRRLFRLPNSRWRSIITPCRKHMLQTIRSVAMSHFDSTVSGMVHLGL